MDKDLEAKIEARRNRAKKRNIRGKAMNIAKYLGQGYERDDNRNYTFEDSDFLINDSFKVYHSHDGGMPAVGTEISYKGNKVFDMGGGTIYSYIPGEWEGKLNKLYAKAKEARIAKEKEEGKKREEELAKKEADKRAKWGL